MKRFVSLFLSLALFVFGTSVYSFAEKIDRFNDDKAQLQYVYTSQISSHIAMSSNDAACHSLVRGYSDKVTKITITQELQKIIDSEWKSIDGRGTTVFASSATFDYTHRNLSSGTYRVKTIAIVYSGSNYETVTAYSSAASC